MIELTKEEAFEQQLAHIKSDLQTARKDLERAEDRIHELEEQNRKLLFLCSRVRIGWDALQQLLEVPK
jgi:septal ring factor EnvC (AmiA/AmiB activator)